MMRGAKLTQGDKKDMYAGKYYDEETGMCVTCDSSYYEDIDESMPVSATNSAVAGDKNNAGVGNYLAACRRRVRAMYDAIRAHQK